MKTTQSGQLRKRILSAAKKRLILGASVALLVGGCIIDTDDPCNEGQVVATDGSKLCICPESKVLTPAGCVVCGSNEVIRADSCNCLPGYERVTPEDECTALPPTPPPGDNDAGLGGDLNLTGGTTTLPGGGLGDSCTSPADCAGKDASFCESFSLMQCTVSGCDLANDNCPDTYVCCDLSSVGVMDPLCLPGGCSQ